MCSSVDLNIEGWYRMKKESEFEKIYQTYYMQIYSYVMTIIKNPDYAEEITQETFFKAIKSKSEYRGESHQLTWLCAIAKNTCLDMLRKQSRYCNNNEDVKTSKSIENVIVEKEAIIQIYQVLHTLDEPYKEVFGMRVFGELSFRDIAEVFGKTESWARVTYHRARLKIQKEME